MNRKLVKQKTKKKRNKTWRSGRCEKWHLKTLTISSQWNESLTHSRLLLGLLSSSWESEVLLEKGKNAPCEKNSKRETKPGWLTLTQLRLNVPRSLSLENLRKSSRMFTKILEDKTKPKCGNQFCLQTQLMLYLFIYFPYSLM